VLDALGEPHRTAVILFAVEGYTHDEIGRLLGIPAGTSKSRLSEARRKLRDLRGAPDYAGATR